MKICIYILAFISHLTLYSQYELDTSKLKLFGTRKLFSEQIKQADSLLIHAVNYYNSKQRRFYSMMNLNDSLYLEYVKLRDQRAYYKQFFSKKGKIKKGAIRKLEGDTPLSDREFIDHLIYSQDLINQRINELEKINTSTEDTIVRSWGAMGHIDLKNYYRQYKYNSSEEGAVNSILVSCYCEEIAREIKKIQPMTDDRLITVHDGGNCFFTIFLDLKKNTANRMRVNGVR